MRDVRVGEQEQLDRTRLGDAGGKCPELSGPASRWPAGLDDGQRWSGAGCAVLPPGSGKRPGQVAGSVG